MHRAVNRVDMVTVLEACSKKGTEKETCPKKKQVQEAYPTNVFYEACSRKLYMFYNMLCYLGTKLLKLSKSRGCTLPCFLKLTASNKS